MADSNDLGSAATHDHVPSSNSAPAAIKATEISADAPLEAS